MTPAEQRRAAPRHDAPADWSAKYRTEASPELGWRDARLIDISETGAALEPFELVPDETLDGIVELKLGAPSGSPEEISLRGEVRHATRSSLGRVRVGIAFVGLSAREAHLVELISRLYEAP